MLNKRLEIFFRMLFCPKQQPLLSSVFFFNSVGIFAQKSAQSVEWREGGFSKDETTLNSREDLN